jgi:hypothetical protein
VSIKTESVPECSIYDELSSGVCGTELLCFFPFGGLAIYIACKSKLLRNHLWKACCVQFEDGHLANTDSRGGKEGTRKVGRTEEERRTKK